MTENEETKDNKKEKELKQEIVYSDTNSFSGKNNLSDNCFSDDEFNMKPTNIGNVNYYDNVIMHDIDNNNKLEENDVDINIRELKDENYLDNYAEDQEYLNINKD